MKAITLYEPWASLVAVGAKGWETRSWRVNHRGLLAIHSGQHFGKQEAELCLRWPFNKFIPRDEIPVLPLGCIVAVAELHEIITTTEWIRLFCSRGRDERTRIEYEFGDYSQNRYAWRLGNIRRLKEPVQCRGKMRIWDVPAEAAAAVNAQL